MSTMNDFVNTLGLDFDPLDTDRQVLPIYSAGDREELLQQLINATYYSTKVLIVTGPLGCGKTCLSHGFCRSFADEAILVRVPATLFMNEVQLLESICEKAGVDYSGMATAEQLIDRLVDFSTLIAKESRSLNIVIDDAHELGLEALETLGQLLQSTVEASTHLLLLGEKQMLNVLENTKREGLAPAKLSFFELLGFSAEQTKDYLQFKLNHAGYKSDFPLSGAVIGEITNKSQGLPGSINVVARQYLNELEPAATPKSSISVSLIPVKYIAIAVSLIVVLLVVVFVPGASQNDNQRLSDQPGRQSVPVTVGAVRELTPPGQALLEQTNEDLSTPTSQTLNDAQPELAQEEPEAVESVPETVGSAQEIAEQGIEGNSLQNNGLPTHAIPTRAYSVFEQGILDTDANNFALQLLGTRSEASAQTFVASAANADGYGYFQTRYQGGLWFVVVYGNFESRDLATAAVALLPSAQQDLQPWARSVGSIQASIELP